jgi:hypothetical protein
VWILTEDYFWLKHEYVKLAASDEGEQDDGNMKGEEMNWHKADAGR